MSQEEHDDLGNSTPEGTPERGKRVMLYVEDNPSNVLLMENIIKRRPQVKLITAHNGLLGIELAQAHRPDLLVVDINLPGISGLELCRRMKSSPETRHIPLIALSANAMPRDIQSGLEAGFSTYLTKPLSVLKFLAELDALLGKIAPST
ncbi:MAG: response regulator [Betaproteobacteria bacterium]|nr:response regulator [Betaproteobacteria bacterium]